MPIIFDDFVELEKCDAIFIMIIPLRSAAVADNSHFAMHLKFKHRVEIKRLIFGPKTIKFQDINSEDLHI